MKKSIRISNILVLAGLLALLPSCMRMGANGARLGKAMETFYVEGGLIQYFIKPLHLKGSNTSASVDFTYRHDPKKENAVTCNFSLKSSNASHVASQAYFLLEKEKIEVKNLKKLAYSKNKSTYTFRYTSNMTYDELKRIVQSKSFSLVIFTKDKKELVHKPSSKSKRKLKTVDEKMISVVELDKAS